MRYAGRYAGSILFAATIWSQTFEVASVRQSPPPAPNARVFYGPPRGGPGTRDPERITWTNAALRDIVMKAYAVQTHQLEAPAWLASARYDIAAKVPSGATREQVNVMWQNLLTERFGLVLHHESREIKVQELTVARGGPKLKPTELEADAEPFTPAEGPPKFDRNGFPEMNGSGTIMSIEVHGSARTGRMAVRGLTLPEIAIKLANLVRMPVLDKTGLTGRYDFYLLDFTPDFTGVPPPPGVTSPPDAAIDPGSDVQTAVEKQLGLKLTPRKANLDVIVIDHAEKVPTEN